ncbi:conserved hypothetical protein [Bosea sp. 62]|nr:conserved hypothetical protein [Bosea sp. 46]CAD5249404.1 conserved hypothetical protein [Bosea sp. 21B]CAD5266712.1 conserved hypothetical protein [Bosea sp. 7B]VVT45017.1 hypothetical protein BOS5A_10665 [Bosea sp. EC-HK365B]VXB00674.1 conserved hypothetical protein [Bosea sp. 29B]VXB01280.1 conserved hypothetical protein [Bosea sp. 125]VXB89270.1 conserved hypothetical protein [Bosea sp. 62]VXC52899.1 conserved hypothetical protein [Bosea sp. 127]
MGRIGNAGARLFILDLSVEISSHTVEFRDHHLNLAYPAALLVHLEAFETQKGLSRLHVVPNS